MNAYHEIDGIPCAASRKLLTDILRKEWGFQGIVVSDYSAIEMLRTFHFVASDKKEAAKLSLEAGIDIELPDTNCYGTPLKEAIEQGLVSEETLDQAVCRVLTMKFELGLFDRDLEVDPARVSVSFDRPEDRELALRAALESIILLKNKEKLLPLGKDLKSIAVIGPAADNPLLYFGDYTYTAHLAFDEPMVPCPSILEAIKEKVSAQTEVFFAPGCERIGDSKEGFPEAVAAAKKAEVVIVALGESSGFTSSDTTGEGRDSHNLKLPGVQEELLKEVVKTGKPVVLVLTNGRVFDLSWVSENVPAILEAWFPGEEGARAIAEVLFGDYNPGGKLPVSFPKAVGQLPVYYHRKNSSLEEYIFLDSEPLFPFGHGLSYTDFAYSDLKVEPEKLQQDQTISVSVDVKNKGSLKGEEVVQLYVKDVVASVARPVMQLKGFARISLEPQEKARVIFDLPSEILSFYDREMNLIIEPGLFEVLVGSSAKDIRAEGKFEIEGKPKIITERKHFFSRVEVTKR